MKAITHTEPLLCTCGNNLKKKWFVHFDITNNLTSEIKRLQFRGVVNKQKSIAGRLKEGNELLKFWKEELNKGWTPFKNFNEDVPDFSNMQFSNALDFALSKCDVAKKTKQGYAGTVRFFQDAANRLMLSTYPVEKIEKRHIKLMLGNIKEHRAWSNKSCNKNLNYIQCVISQLVEWEVLKYNPAHKIKSLRIAETNKYVPYTDEEKKIIREYFYLHHYRYFIILMTIYHTGIRPKEVLALKIKDVDVENAVITIQPDIERENSKTRSIRLVPINQFLITFFREMHLEAYPDNYFVFASIYKNGNRGSYKRGVSGIMHPDYFKPGTIQIKRDTITRFWKRVVIDKLGIKKYQYAAKATGADDKILAGISVDALKGMYGHSSKLMTEKYISVLKKIQMKEIKELSPDF